MDKNEKNLVLHIITSLGEGGAESVLYKLCAREKSFTHVVVCLTGSGKYSEMLSAIGVEVYCLGMNPGKISLPKLGELYAVIKRYRPDVVQTWMYHSDLIGGLVARMAGCSVVLWNIRHSVLVSGKTKKSTILVARLCALLSGIIPRYIVCCAESARKYHAGIGYSNRKMRVIHNGVSLKDFYPVEKKPTMSDRPVIGCVARYSADKDHENLLHALSLLKARGYEFSCHLIGSGLDKNNLELVRLINDLHLGDSVRLLGSQKNVCGVMNDLDIHVLPSRSEGFPNVLAEAMACGVPCVSTDVGDAALIVGNFGWIIEPGNSEKLADGIKQAIEKRSNHDEWMDLKKACRKSMEDNFDIDGMVASYQNIWKLALQ